MQNTNMEKFEINIETNIYQLIISKQNRNRNAFSGYFITNTNTISMFWSFFETITKSASKPSSFAQAWHIRTIILGRSITYFRYCVKIRALTLMPKVIQSSSKLYSVRVVRIAALDFRAEQRKYHSHDVTQGKMCYHYS